MRHQWTRERIIRHVLEREAKGLPLHAGRDGVDNLLYQAARRFFGSWRNAIRAAGIMPERVLTWERWSPAKVLMIIRRLAHRDRPLSGPQLERRYGSMMSAARRYYGSWTKAVLAAGVDPTRLQRIVPWNQGRVIEAILTRALRNESLAPHDVEPRSLAVAGERLFGNWTAAVTAAGLDLKAIPLLPARPKEPQAPRQRAPRPRAVHQPRQLWTKELVITAIHARLRERKHMNARSLAREDRGLYRAARRHLKNWSNALAAAGLDPDAYRVSPQRKEPPQIPGTREPSSKQSQPTGVVRPDHPA